MPIDDDCTVPKPGLPSLPPWNLYRILWYRCGRARGRGRGTMPIFRFPLSGNVTQTINPWTWFFNPVGSQVGLVNIELGQSSNPAIEEEVLSDVASYGKQLGRIEDALIVLVAHF